MISYVWALVAANLTACVVCSGYLLLAPKLASPFMGAIKSTIANTTTAKKWPESHVMIELEMLCSRVNNAEQSRLDSSQLPTGPHQRLVPWRAGRRPRSGGPGFVRRGPGPFVDSLVTWTQPKPILMIHRQK